MLDVIIFDSSDFESRLARNEELMTLVAAEFLKEATGLLALLDTYIMECDWHNLGVVTNRLRGAGLEVSGYQFCEKLNDLQRIIDNQAAPQLNTVMSALNTEFDRLSLALKHEILK
ncbi:Hpt domain-containing protein [Marinomonas posidonica]|uniref:Hpt domain-containing protein n=1 Tax=Marinomonas posidonica TaxID=936476 RepID=UPI0037350C1F